MYVGQRRERMTATLQAIPDGRAGTLATLKIMKQITRAGKTNLGVRDLAARLAATVGHKDWYGQVKAVHDYVQSHIRYVKDIRGVETVQTPEVTLDIKAGDCDDQSILVASLLESIGHPTRFVAIAFRPDDFVHVYSETRIGNAWVPVETTEPWPVGRGPNGVKQRLIINN